LGETDSEAPLAPWEQRTDPVWKGIRSEGTLQGASLRVPIFAADRSQENP
jgi:hypothetical protein